MPSGNFTASLLRRFIVWLVAIKLAGLVLVFDPAGLDVFNLPKTVWSLGTEWLLLALLGVAVLRYGPAIVPITRLHLFVAAFVAANVLSAIFAENKYIALFGERDQYLGLLFVVDMFVLYWAVAVAFRRNSDWVVLGTFAALAAVAALGYGAIQRIGLDPITWEDAGVDRPSSTFGNPDLFGHYLSAMFGAAVGLAAFAIGRGSLVARLAAFSLGIAALVGAAVVATRGSLLGFGAVLIVGAFLYVVQPRESSRSKLGPVVVGLGVVAIIGALVAFSPLGERAAATAAGSGIRDRLFIYASAAQAFADRPILGYGPDSFGVAYPSHRMPGVTEVTGPGVTETSAHSWPLQIAATLGVVGLASFLAMLIAFGVMVIRTGLRSSPGIAACAALATAGYLGHGLVSISAPSIDWIPWLALGAVASGSRRREAVVRGNVLRHVFAFASLLTVAVALVLAGLPALLANEDAHVAKFQWKEGLSGEATIAAISAVQRDSGRADYWNWLGLALEQQKLWRFAGDAYAEAVERAPHSPTYWSNFARARTWQALEGEDAVASAGMALEAARRGAAADPNSPEPNGVLAEIAYTFGRYDLALDAATRAIGLHPSGGYDDIAASAALAADNAAVARQKLEGVASARDSAILQLAIAQLSLKLNDLSGARAHAERVLELKPESVEAQGVIAKTNQ